MKFRSICTSALFCLISCQASALAQVNQFDTVVFGSKIPLYLDDPTGGMPVRNTTNDHSAFVPRISGARALLMSPSGETFVTCQGDTASLWSIARGQELLALQHGGPISWLSITYDGTSIITAGNTWIRTWDSRGEFRKQCDLKAEIRKLIVSRDGLKMVAVTAQDIQIWSVRDGLLLTKIPVSNPVAALVLSPDGSQMAVLDGNNAAIWQTGDGQMLGTIAHEDPIKACMYSPDSTRVLFSTPTWTYLWDAKNFVKISNVQYGGGYR